ncbi:50S ribosomal protein L9 [Palleronia caenipelagi]|uniref:Large ribosomal subunit protein bL9 n=1 Tax=Palleronia caenipelagi TaxID=2489174 RepID=A0A547PY10_9RHOB|nr:50S ribosomal protein L9 [Palleronia caenipelagi]TRD19051.1 50S ribosomal protein L9 [Palleronia caenipelagi]
MNVILLERVAKLGEMGQVVSVKEGYARNFLLPQKKALWASKANVEAFEEQKAQLAERNAETRAEAQALADRIEGQQFIVIRAASDAGALYGSVSTRDVAEAANEAGFAVERRQVSLAAPIKDLGLHKAHITLHPEVQADVELNVARSMEEAELQKQGKTIQELASEEEAAAEFEIQELFDDIGGAAMDDESGTDDEQPSA